VGRCSGYWWGASQRPLVVAGAAGKPLGFGGSAKGVEEEQCRLYRAAGVPLPAVWGVARFKIPDKYTLTGRDLLGAAGVPSPTIWGSACLWAWSALFRQPGRQGFLSPRFGGLRLCGGVSALACWPTTPGRYLCRAGRGLRARKWRPLRARWRASLFVKRPPRPPELLREQTAAWFFSRSNSLAVCGARRRHLGCSFCWRRRERPGGALIACVGTGRARRRDWTGEAPAIRLR
jgi:hypothetical protein